jgi:nitroreductase/NAD-dependent dihydropyrimidine dehydrogenase PreA subunit
VIRGARPYRVLRFPGKIAGGEDDAPAGALRQPSNARSSLEVGTMSIFIVDEGRCSRCGDCVSDCPARIIALGDDGPAFIPAEQEQYCIRCQHCLAICPEGAVSIHGHHPEDSRPLLAEALPSLEQLDLLVRGRRSVRQYRRENVEPGLVERLLDAVACAPTGSNARELTFAIIRDGAVLDVLRMRVITGLADALGAGLLTERNASFAAAVIRADSEGRDLIFRGAPHLLVVSSPTSTSCPQQDVHIALATFDLLAQSAGLGTVWCGYLRRAFDALPELKDAVGLPREHVYYPLLFGYPSVRYARTVERKGSAIVRGIDSFA